MNSLNKRRSCDFCNANIGPKSTYIRIGEKVCWECAKLPTYGEEIQRRKRDRFKNEPNRNHLPRMNRERALKYYQGKLRRIWGREYIIRDLNLRMNNGNTDRSSQ